MERNILRCKEISPKITAAAVAFVALVGASMGTRAESLAAEQQEIASFDNNGEARNGSFEECARLVIDATRSQYLYTANMSQVVRRDTRGKTSAKLKLRHYLMVGNVGGIFTVGNENEGEEQVQCNGTREASVESRLEIVGRRRISAPINSAHISLKGNDEQSASARAFVNYSTMCRRAKNADSNVRLIKSFWVTYKAADLTTSRTLRGESRSVLTC